MKKVIVLIWRISSWKDYAWDFLEKNIWWKHVWISSSLRFIARDRWVEETRENLIKIWRQLTQKYGDWYLAEVLISRESDNELIISWARQIWQLKYLKENTDCVIIWIESHQEIRYQRMLQRWKIGEDITFDVFQKIEKKEEKTVQKVWVCLTLCDIIIENNWSLEEFEQKILKVIKNSK